MTALLVKFHFFLSVPSACLLCIVISRTKIFLDAKRRNLRAAAMDTSGNRLAAMPLDRLP